MEKDFFVDNFLSGADTKAETRLPIEQMKDLRKAGGFNLRKCAANDLGLLLGIPDESKEVGLHEITQETEIAMLGITVESNDR